MLKSLKSGEVLMRLSRMRPSQVISRVVNRLDVPEEQQDLLYCWAMRKLRYGTSLGMVISRLQQSRTDLQQNEVHDENSASEQIGNDA